MPDICKILKESKTIAVIGISDKPGRISGIIASFLKDKGYNVIGIHPVFKKVNDIKVYSSLNEIDFDIDIVNVFRRSDAIYELVPDILTKNRKFSGCNQVLEMMKQ